MSPNVRRAFHEALDLVLDAMAQDRGEIPVKPKRRSARKPAEKPPASPRVDEKIDQILRSKGLL